MTPINCNLQNKIQDIIQDNYYREKVRELTKNSQNSYLKATALGVSYKYLPVNIILRDKDILKIFNKLKNNDQFCKDTFSELHFGRDKEKYLKYHSNFRKIFFSNNITQKDIEELYNLYKDNNSFVDFLFCINYILAELSHSAVFGSEFSRIKALGVEICEPKIIKSLVSTFLNSNQEILLKTPNSIAKRIEINSYTEKFDNNFCIKLLEKNKVYPKSVLYNHKFSETEILNMLEKCPVFKSKSKIMGGIQEQRQNACNHIIKSQTISLKIIHKILDECFPNEEEKFLKSLGNRAILINNLPLDDELVSKMVDAGTNFKFYDTSKLTEESQLLIEVSK